MSHSEDMKQIILVDVVPRNVLDKEKKEAENYNKKTRQAGILKLLTPSVPPISGVTEVLNFCLTRFTNAWILLLLSVIAFRAYMYPV